MLMHNLLLAVVTAVVGEMRADPNARSFTSDFYAPTLGTSQLCEDEWYTCELQSSGW